MVGIRGFWLCTARGFDGYRLRKTTAALNTSASTLVSCARSSSSSAPAAASSADNSPRSDPSPSTSSCASSPPSSLTTQQDGYKPYIPKRFRRYTSGTAVGDYNMLRKAFVRNSYSEYHHKPMEAKWEGIRAALKPLGRVSTGNTFKAYYDTGDAYRDMWSSVEGAKQTVKWQTYICKDDAVGKKTVRLIEEAHDRGVQVELLYDCGGNITGRSSLTHGLKQRAGANVIAYRPFLINLFRYYRNGMSWQHSPALRSHRKILIVDESVGYAGGLNVGDDYCSKDAGGNGRFRDTHCRVTGPCVKHLMEVYDDTITPLMHNLKPWRTIMAASARRRLQYLKARARQSQDAAANVTKAAKNTVTTASSGAKRTLRRIMAIKDSQLPRFKFRKPRLPSGGGAPATRLEFARSLAYIRSSAHSLSRAMTNTASAMSHSASVASHKAADAVEHSIEKAYSSAKEGAGALFKEPATDDQPIPESKQYVGQPSETQILMCNPLTLDWSLPMAMWLVTQDAHRRVWVTTPYYLPHRKLTAAVITTARRGVDVRIIAGSRSTTDPWFMWYASQFVTQRFLQAGVRVYEFEGGQIMHSKTVVVDSVWSSVGSYNWDVLSNKLLEQSVTTFGTVEAAMMEDHFRQDLAKSREITLEEFMNRSLFRRFQCAFFYYGMRFAEMLSFWSYYDPQISTQQQ